MKCEMKNKIEEILFYLFLTIMFTVKGLGLYDGQRLYNVFFVISFMCILFKILISKYTLFEFSFVSILGFLAVVINRISGEKGVLIIFAILVGMRNIPLIRTMKVGVISLGISSLLNAIISMFCIPDEKMYWRTYRLGLIKSFGWDLGQPHPNTTSIVYLAIVSMIIILLGKCYKGKHLLLLSIGNFLVYFYCASNTGVIICELMIVLSFFAVHIKDLKKLGYFVIKLAYPFCIVFSFSFPWLVPDKILNLIEMKAQTLYSRIILSRYFVTYSNMKLFGIKVITITDSSNTLDNSFLYCGIFNGIISIVLLSVGYFFLINRYARKKKNVELMIIVCFLLEGLLEPFLFNTSFKNITLFFLGECIWDYFAGKRKSTTSTICILGNLEFGNKVENIIDSFYKKLSTYMDVFLWWTKGEHKIKTKMIIISSIFAIVMTYILKQLWPVTEDFFKPSGMYDFLINCNELDKGIRLESNRRSLFVFLLCCGGIYSLLILIEKIKSHIKFVHK